MTTEIKMEMHSLNKTLNDIGPQLSALQTRLNTVENTIIQVLEEKTKNSQHIEGMIKSSTILQHRINTVEENNNSLKNTTTALQSDTSQLENDITTLTSVVGLFKNEMTTLTSGVDSFKNKQENLVKLINSLEIDTNMTMQAHANILSLLEAKIKDIKDQDNSMSTHADVLNKLLLIEGKIKEIQDQDLKIPTHAVFEEIQAARIVVDCDEGTIELGNLQDSIG